MIILSLLRRTGVARGVVRTQCQYRSFSISLARRNAQRGAAGHDAQLENIRNIGIIAHVDAVSRAS